MIKTRDAVAIGNVGEYLLQSNDELKNEKINIEKNINSILDNYDGKDAQVIVLKFLDAANKMDSMMKIFEYYGNYMMILSGHDKDNIKYTSKQMETILNEPLLKDTMNMVDPSIIDEVNHV